MYTQINLNNQCISKKPGHNNNNFNNQKNTMYYPWKFGTLNIRSGKEKDEGFKLYSIAKEAAKANLSFCCIQEVKYLNSGSKVITLDTGDSFVFLWSGQKKRRNAGVGVLIKQSKDVKFDDPDVLDSRMIALNLEIKGFKIRLVTVYAHTNCDGHDNQKDTFYRSLKKACIKQHKHQKIFRVVEINLNVAKNTLQKIFVYSFSK